MWSWLFALSFHLAKLEHHDVDRLVQQGYLHLDISIGNLVMIDDAVTTEGFRILKKEGSMTTVETQSITVTTALQELKIDSSTDSLHALHDLNITNKCHGFVIE